MIVLEVLRFAQHSELSLWLTSDLFGAEFCCGLFGSSPCLQGFSLVRGASAKSRRLILLSLCGLNHVGADMHHSLSSLGLAQHSEPTINCRLRSPVSSPGARLAVSYRYGDYKLRDEYLISENVVCVCCMCVGCGVYFVCFYSGLDLDLSESLWQGCLPSIRGR